LDRARPTRSDRPTIDHRWTGVTTATTPFSKFSPKNFTDFRARSNAWIDLLSAEQPSAGLSPGETQKTVYALYAH
jgi:hypothetical protein